MLKRFLSLTAKDLKLITRNGYVIVVVVMALIYIGLIAFVLPADIATSATVVLWDTSGSQAVRQFYQRAVDTGESDSKVIFVDSQAEYDEAMSVYGSRLGLKVEGQAAPDRVVVTYQGHESPQVRNLLEASLREQIAALNGTSVPSFQTETLRPGVAAEKPPFNLSLLPILIFTEAVMVGLLLAAALLYSEKGEGTLRAYRVTPGRALEYLLAKSVAMGLLGLVFTVILTVATMGIAVNWVVILGVVFLSAVVTTLFTLVVANLFDTISQFLFSGVVLNLVLALPMVSYFYPSVSLGWFRWLPSYPIIFALREAYFPTGSPAALGSAVWQIVLTLVIVLPLAVVGFRRQLIARDV